MVRQPPRQVPPPERRSEERRATYSRFIPGEELQGVRTWNPSLLGEAEASGFAPLRSSGSAAEATASAARASEPAPPPPPAAPPEPSLHEQLHEARQTGYQDGYRDGMAALDAFKQSFAQQMSAQIGAIAGNFDAEFRALEEDMAQSVARIAVELARQVVRSELATRPELIARVAHDAVEALQASARQVRVRVHPDDLALVQQGLGEEFAARQALLLPDPEIARGGVKVDADIASVDASIATRWQQAVAALGQSDLWEDRRGEAE
ncbi:FliH/SctL family protein [Roseateles sp.]|uniref:FliH/SctL family protein n=1 Tax=Roseateles sp. TaxID=1971397 RepID=UPI0039210B1F